MKANGATSCISRLFERLGMEHLHSDRKLLAGMSNVDFFWRFQRFWTVPTFSEMEDYDLEAARWFKDSAAGGQILKLLSLLLKPRKLRNKNSIEKKNYVIYKFTYRTWEAETRLQKSLLPFQIPQLGIKLRRMIRLARIHNPSYSTFSFVLTLLLNSRGLIPLKEVRFIQFFIFKNISQWKWVTRS